jgi:hypothetical protein
MNNLARELRPEGEVLGARGTVERREATAYRVRTSDGSILARRAAGCLLDPAPGDVVLVGAAGEEAWILVVLERDPARSTEIAVEGDLRLRSSRGKVAVVGQEGVDLISAGATKLVSRTVEVRSTSASVVVEGIELVGGWVRAEVDRARVVAQSLEHVLDRFTQRVRRSYRKIEDIEQVQAGTIHQRVEKTMRMHAGDAAVTADGIVKVDGKQIHVG